MNREAEDRFFRSDTAAAETSAEAASASAAALR